MDSRKLLLLVAALFVAGVTAFLARSLIAGNAAPQAAAAPNVAPPVATGPKVLVATRALPVGTILDAGAVRFQPWPKELVEGAYFREGGAFDIKTVVGTVVRVAVTAGQPVTRGALVKPGDRGFLAAALGPGMRAVTVPVSTQSSVAGFVFPGDHVDLLLTQTVAGQSDADGPPLRAAETIMRNLRVLATDQRTTDDRDDAGNTIVRTFSTVTIEATPPMAEQIAVAQTLGSLSLSLRSIADNEAQLRQAVAGAGDAAMALPVAGMPQAGRSTYSVGGEISRFQRRTMARAGAGRSGGTGPVVRVARGSVVDEVPVGPRRAATAAPPAPARPAPDAGPDAAAQGAN